MKAENLVKTKDIRVTVTYGCADSDFESVDGEDIQVKSKIVPKLVPIVIAPGYEINE